MTNWITHTRKGGTTPEPTALVTFRNNQIVFNKHCIDSNKLEGYRYVSIEKSKSELKLGFRFFNEIPSINVQVYKLSYCGREPKPSCSTGKHIKVRSLMKEEKWIEKVSKSENEKLRRFEPIWDKSDDLLIVQLSPAFENTVGEESLIPNTATGIYRYKLGKEIVYIGKGQIKSRIGSPERDIWNFDLIEYSEINSDEDRSKWESYWIDKFKEANNGELPFYNKVSGKKFIEG